MEAKQNVNDLPIWTRSGSMGLSITNIPGYTLKFLQLSSPKRPSHVFKTIWKHCRARPESEVFSIIITPRCSLWFLTWPVSTHCGTYIGIILLGIINIPNHTWRFETWYLPKNKKTRKYENLSDSLGRRSVLTLSLLQDTFDFLDLTFSKI